MKRMKKSYLFFNETENNTFNLLEQFWQRFISEPNDVQRLTPVY